MSTATLLIVAARLRSIARPDGREHPASSAVPLSGRSRVTRSIARVVTTIRRTDAGSRPQPSLPGKRSHPLACAGARYPFARARVLVTASLAFILAPLLPAQSAMARQGDDRQSVRPPLLVLPPVTVEADALPEPQAQRQIGGTPTPGPCVIVDIGGTRAGHLECATDRLQAAARAAQARSNAGIDADVAAAGSPDVQVGVAHRAATRLRMGDALGRSVHPERPHRPMPMPRGGQP